MHYTHMQTAAAHKSADEIPCFPHINMKHDLCGGCGGGGGGNDGACALRMYKLNEQNHSVLRTQSNTHIHKMYMNDGELDIHQKWIWKLQWYHHIYTTYEYILFHHIRIFEHIQ